MTKEYLREFREMKKAAAVSGNEKEVARRQAEIDTAIEILPPLERAVITAHYCRLMTWAQVAEALHYDERQIYRLHGRALKKLSENVSRRA